MCEGKSFLAIIPVRGRSKRLPRKNMLDFFDKPSLFESIISKDDTNTELFAIHEYWLDRKDRKI